MLQMTVRDLEELWREKIGQYDEISLKRSKLDKEIRSIRMAIDLLKEFGIRQ